MRNPAPSLEEWKCFMLHLSHIYFPTEACKVSFSSDPGCPLYDQNILIYRVRTSKDCIVMANCTPWEFQNRSVVKEHGRILNMLDIPVTC